MKNARLVQLECARGIASVVVVFHHLCLAFAVTLKANALHGGLRETPLYIFINGTGAVTFFFTLSGFALTYGFFKQPSLNTVVASVLKRLPRLMVPAGVSIFLGLAILELAGAPYLGASQLSGSRWLGDFANAEFPKEFTPSIRDAAQQILFVFLIPHDFYYNSNLWTMVNEFYGSILVFALASLVLIKSCRTDGRMIALHAILFGVLSFVAPDLRSFVVGSLLAYGFAQKSGHFQLSKRLSVLFLVGAVIGFSTEKSIANMLASVLVMLALLGSRTLSRALSGRSGRLLGLISFPLYLVHTLVILSLSSLAYTTLMTLGWGIAAAFLAVCVLTLLASIVACLPFVALEYYWVRWLNLRAKHLSAKILEILQPSVRTGADLPKVPGA